MRKLRLISFCLFSAICFILRIPLALCAEPAPDYAQYRWQDQMISRSMTTDHLHNVSLDYHWVVAAEDLLHVGQFKGEFSLYNSFKFWGELPILYVSGREGGGEGTVGNGAVGLKGRIHSNLEAFYPYFFYLKMGARMPRTGRGRYLVDRLDYLLEVTAKKELERLTLGSAAGYTLKYDGPGEVDYKDEIKALVKGEFELYDFLGVEGEVQYRHSFGFHDGREGENLDLGGQSIMIGALSAKYRPSLGVSAILSWYQPLRVGGFETIAKVFGDYISPGLLSPTLLLGLSVDL